jgi:hypothetical protein
MPSAIQKCEKFEYFFEKKSLELLFSKIKKQKEKLKGQNLIQDS